MVRIEAKSGDALRAILPELARLRIEVFRDFPYLYDGAIEHEVEYLGHLLDAPNHVAICAIDGDRLVGAATAATVSPLIQLHQVFTTPLREAGMNIDEIFYFGESVLSRSYRGQGIGHAFFDSREAHAQACGYEKTAFCAVIRPVDHPDQPQNYRPLDEFWKKRGYRPLDGVVTHFPWLDVGNTEETFKPMQYWGRGFDRRP